MRTLLVTTAAVAAVFSSAAFTQEPTLAPASIPDFSGIWGRNWVFFEPPSSGPGPVVGKLPRSPISVGDYGNPILGPPAAEVVRKNGELELSGTVVPNPHNECRLEPTPFSLGLQMGIQVIQQKDKAVLLSLHDHQVRHVRMNVPHSDPPTPSWHGESVGYYDGDTLVIDTVGQKVGPLSMIDAFGTPFSETLHVIERYRLIDGMLARDLQQKHESTYFGGPSPFTNEYWRGDIDPDTTKKGLQVEFTVDDPATFTQPWSGRVTYRRVLGEWPESVCAENTHGSGTSEVVVSTSTCIFASCLVPRADRPDF